MKDSFISSWLDYCNSLLLGISSNYMKRLQLVQNAPAQLITLSKSWHHITPVLKQLHWRPVPTRSHTKSWSLPTKPSTTWLPHTSLTSSPPTNPNSPSDPPQPISSASTSPSSTVLVLPGSGSVAPRPSHLSMCCFLLIHLPRKETLSSRKAQYKFSLFNWTIWHWMKSIIWRKILKCFHQKP